MSGKALPGGGELFDFAAIDRFDQGIAGREVAVERAGSNPGLTGDVIEAGARAVACEGLLGDLEDALAVALSIGAGLAGGRTGRELLF